MRLEGKTIIVAGGCGLIGSAVVKVLANQGATVKSFDIKPGADFTIDISKDLHRFTNTLKDLGPVSGFVNAVYPTGFTQHLECFLLPSEHIAKHMVKHGGGSIVLLGSIYGVVAPNGRNYRGTRVSKPTKAYAVLKGGITALSGWLAAEYAPLVRVNCVSPGGVLDGQDKKFVKRYEKHTLIGRMATPEDIAEPIAFLVGGGASYITGQNIIVDGGYTAI